MAGDILSTSIQRRSDYMDSWPGWQRWLGIKVRCQEAHKRRCQKSYVNASKQLRCKPLSVN